MAKRREAIPGRKPRDRARKDDSLLVKSAESLGRVIAELQQQLDAMSTRLSRGRRRMTRKNRRS